jgi:hypothetical protein
MPRVRRTPDLRGPYRLGDLIAAVAVTGEAPELRRGRLLNTTDRPAVMLLNGTGTAR